MHENTDSTEVQSTELPNVRDKMHLTGAIYVISVETEAGIVTVRAGLDGEEMIVTEREGDLTPEVLDAVVDHFDADSAREGGVGV